MINIFWELTIVALTVLWYVDVKQHSEPPGLLRCFEVGRAMTQSVETPSPSEMWDDVGVGASLGDSSWCRVKILVQQDSQQVFPHLGTLQKE